jgi:hypothetical protein
MFVKYNLQQFGNIKIINTYKTDKHYLWYMHYTLHERNHFLIMNYEFSQINNIKFIYSRL